MLRGKLGKNEEWNELIDLFIARDIETIRDLQEKEQAAKEENSPVEAGEKKPEVPAAGKDDEDW